jgi:hypothetical protein
MTIKAVDINDLTIHKGHSDWVLRQAKELKSLLNYNSEDMIKKNKARALADIATMQNSLAELKLYIEEL